MTKPPFRTRFKGPEDSPGFLLWRVSNAWQRAQRAALAPIGLTHTQFVILATATWFGAKGPLTQARIAEVSGVDAMTTSQTVRALERRRILERKAHPTDPRANAIEVTTAGRDKVKRAIVAVEEADAKFFSRLGKGETQLVKVLQKLARVE